MLPLFPVSLIVLFFPQNLAADKGPFYFLEYGGLLFLRYLPLVGLAALVKLYLLKRKFSLNWRTIGKIAVKTISEIYAEIVYFLLLFFLLSPIIHDKILDNIGFIAGIKKNPAALKLLFTIIILLPLQCLLAAILNLVLLHSYWSDEMEKSVNNFSYGLYLSFIFPIILIAFTTAGFLSGLYTPLL
jgi:hypothetical protein